MNYTAKDHTFAICAYGESRYLENCIESVFAQKIKTNVIIATSTPNDYIKGLAEKYNIRMYVNDKMVGKSNIATDWNYAVGMTKTPLVTITHQDDIYHPDYARVIIKNINRTKHPLIAFTDYSELRNGGIEVKSNKLLNIKRIMLFPMRPRWAWSSKFIRRRMLSLGSAICCPSVTYVKDNLPQQLFIPSYKGVIDWQAWERFSRLKGEFVFCNDILMSHRIHAESETTALIADSNRSREDFEMYCKFWPKWIARILEHFYRKGEEQNNLD